VVHFNKNLRLGGRPPATSFARIDRPYNFIADNIHTTKLCSRLSSSEVQFYTKNGRCAFWVPLWGLRDNVQCSS